ncbi:Electron transport complex subunit RsxB [Caloramator mitchellensis]|uniref:Electron transport complex subunit RsxB n=1 Tax=Caloramator mitchellensis TaxID=908809 RepID=A0A0R3JW88_CALMK|nr:4Fe-4S binding protein [Caloramator mitchellensis]KRQ87819.1 Electron transport complex subunit RsxB [Caloramator mitchellensis]
MIRKIVHIDEEKCNGCGLCIPNCVEGALQIIDGKAKLVSDTYCDGLGACLGHCPQDAITIIEREADEFDEKAVEEYLKSMGRTLEHSHGHNQHNHNEHHAHHHHMGGCPGSMMRQINREVKDEKVTVSSKLRQWPVQLALVSPQAPYFYRADLLIAADCAAYAYGNFHNDFIKDRTVVVGCPKLDDNEYYTKKLAEIIKNNDLESITVTRMEVPCCSGIAMAARMARDMAGVNIPVKVVTISAEGEIISREYV